MKGREQMNETKSKRLEQDYVECEKVIKDYSKSFYYAFSQLPEPDAKAVYAIYAFCRTADDIVDEVEDSQEKACQLEKLEVELTSCLNGEPPDTAMWRALTDVINRYSINHDMFYAQLKGQQMDISFTQPEDYDDLVEYCKYIAGSVGQLLLPVLSENFDEERHRQAENLGIAMQLTNILRDIGVDAAHLNRIYIPVSLMEKWNYKEECLINQVVNDNFINMWESLAEVSEDLYDNFLTELKYYKPEAQLPLLVSINVYKEILNEIRKNQYDCFTKKHAVSFDKKIILKKKSAQYISRKL